MKMTTLLVTVSVVALLITAVPLVGEENETAPDGAAQAVSGDAAPETAPDDGASTAAAPDSVVAALEKEAGKLMLQRCSQCHGEGRPTAGLSLERAHFPGSLVGVPSAQVDSLLLVEPGAPDRSYLVWKLESHEGIVGSRMPSGPVSLPDEQVALIRRWIEVLPPAVADTSAPEPAKS